MTHSSDRKAGASLLLGRLADFLRLRAIYPANNQRVQATAREFAELVDERVAESQLLRIRVTPDRATIDDVPIALDRPIMRWVAETLRKVSLEGIDVLGGIDGATLDQFAVELQRCSTGSPQPLAARWPTDRPMLRPIPLVIRGHHLAGSHGKPTSVTAGEDGAAAGRVGELLSRVAEDPRIRDRITKLQSSIDAQFGTDGQREEIDLLDRIVQLVGEDEQLDPSRVPQLIDQVLDGFDQRVIGALANSAEAIDPAISAVARQVADRYFARPDAVPQQPSGEKPVGRPEDEPIKDDLAELVADVQSLPSDQEPPRFENDVEVASHELLVCTDLLATPMLDATPTHAAARIGSLLAARPSLDVRPLDLVLASPREETAVDRARVLRAFHDAGQVQVLFQRRCLDAVTVAGIFPQWFGAWIDSLDPQEAEDGATLRRFLDAVAPDRLEAGCRELVRSRELSDPSRIRRIAALGGRQAGRMLAILCTAGLNEATRAAFELLRGTDLPAIEALALRVLPPQFLPKEHVVALCRLAGGDATVAERLRMDSATLVRRFVQESGGDAGVAEHRLRAIRALAHIPSPQSRALLGDLAKGWPFGSGERKDVRRAATDALREMDQRAAERGRS